MDKRLLKAVEEVYPLTVQQYEQYLPDTENPTAAEKINSMITALHHMGRLTNHTVKMWNDVMRWIIDEGIETITTEHLDVKLDLALDNGLKELAETVTEAEVIKMLDDGRFEEKIDTAINSMHKYIQEDLTGFSTLLAESANKINLTGLGRPLFFAHRGMENIAPENTIISIEYAGQLGMDGVEMDIQDTSDGEWVLMHDDSVDRTTNGTGSLGAKTLAQVKSLTVDAGPFISRYPETKVPTFEESLIVCKKWGLQALVEVKKVNNNANLIKIINTVRQYGMIDSVKIIGPISTLLTMKEEEPRIEYGAFINSFADLNNAIPLLPFAHVSIEKTAVTKEGVQQAHDAGFKVGAWTLNYNDGVIVQTLRDAGVDYITGTVLS